MTAPHWNTWGDGARVTPAAFALAAGHLLSVAVAAVVERQDAEPQRVRRELVAGLALALSLDSPYSVARIDAQPGGGRARSDLRRGAEQANALVLHHAAHAGGRAGDDVQPLPDFVSHCVGYIWTPEVVSLLLGAGGDHTARNHYNEWLWQLVALRDALIPFARPDDMPLAVTAHGLRDIEQARDRLLLELTSRRVAFATLLSHVGAVLGAAAPTPPDAYGVRTPVGDVVPAFLAQEDVAASAWLFDVLQTDAAATGVSYLRSHSADVVGAPADLATVGARPVEVVRIDGRWMPTAQGLRLDVGFDAHRWQVDAGAIALGHRRALRPQAAAAPEAGAAASAPLFDSELSAHELSGCRVLDAPAPTAPARSRSVTVPTDGQWPLVAALLGRIEPGHAVLWRGEELADAGPATASGDLGLVLVDLRPRR